MSTLCYLGAAPLKANLLGKLREAEGVVPMKRKLTASIVREGDWYVAQCLEIDVASQGETDDEALSNNREALELHFEPPTPTVAPAIRPIEVEIDVAQSSLN
jgi:predicted RNase H-like HicB family nuclease